MSEAATTVKLLAELVAADDRAKARAEVSARALAAAKAKTAELEEELADVRDRPGLEPQAAADTILKQGLLLERANVRIAELELWSKVDDQRVAELYGQINAADDRIAAVLRLADSLSLGGSFNGLEVAGYIRAALADPAEFKHVKEPDDG